MVGSAHPTTMPYDPDDTIAAIGTAAGGSPRGMVRLSGPKVFDCLETCFRPRHSNGQLRDTRSPCVLAGFVSITHDNSFDLPCDLFLWPTHRSYTRQPTAELHTLGSPPLLEQLLRTICSRGARLAEPGEFTLRAFLAGRLDLTQAEAVLGVIDAQSSADLQAALSQLAGGLSQPLVRLREQLLQLLAELEAGLDFVEEDIAFITAEQLCEQLTDALAIVAAVALQLSSREDASDLPRVVLSGPPNTGKSSLFNALIKRYSTTRTDRCVLVSNQPGTTRDYVTAVINIHGFASELVDTAGVESISENCSIDQIAQEMTGQQRAQAHLVVRCEEAIAGESEPISPTLPNEILARTKSDLLTILADDSRIGVLCSSIDGSGLEELAQQIYEKLNDTLDETSNSLALTATRCTESLDQAQKSLTRATELATTNGGQELIAAEVRAALYAVGQVVGAVYSDDILDRIFGQFCIGK